MSDFSEMEREHAKIWAQFCDLMKWSTIGVVVLLILLAVFLL